MLKVCPELGQRIAFVFPGQGSQAVGMGADLYQNYPAARKVFQEADDTLGFSISNLCFNGPKEKLGQTINTQPAIMTASFACLRAIIESGLDIEPSFVAGHSVGEYTALTAADALKFSDGLRLVQERARLMHEAGLKSPGGMVAVIGLDMASLEEICQETGTQIANVNSPSQVVVSGTNNGLAWMMDLAKARGAKRVIRLDVSAGFHSFLMEPVTDELAEVVNRMDFSHPRVPVIANATAQPVLTAEEAKTRIIQQVCSCVKWQASVEYMISKGVDTFVEIGPGQTLTGLIKRISRDVNVLNVRNAGDLNSVMDWISSHGKQPEERKDGCAASPLRI